MQKKNDVYFFIFVFLSVGVVTGILGVGLLFIFGKTGKMPVLLVAWLASLVVILSGYLANQWAFTRSHKVFFSVLFGGMGFRILLVTGLVLMIYFNQWMPVLWFLIILAIYYFLFQILEIFILNHQMKKEKTTDSKV